MLAYRFGRALQILAMVDCGVALLAGFVLPPGAYAIQLAILLSAAVLFGAGRILQRRGEASGGASAGPRRARPSRSLEL